ncbi:MAG: KpsF/GutQ family sugar-phosphate isomerase [Acidobacteria bacterium]|nr:KpsF/GutQ family sugar-phosphate isomerase [Acidobacteriota bacterium]
MSKWIEIAREVLELEAKTVSDQVKCLGKNFEQAIEILKNTKGRVIVTGMGKSGLICRKIAATMASTGTPSFFVHPAEAIHGDLGMIVEGDSVIAVSNSGETEEIVRLIEFIRRIGVPIVAMTANPDSTLGTHSDVTLKLNVEKEACPLGLAPTSSTTATLAMGDAIAMVLLAVKSFTPEDFAARHPGGKLGRKLLLVSALMHKGDELPVVSPVDRMQDVIYVMSSKRLGIALVVENAKLLGVISDGDLRRLLEEKGSDLLLQPASDCMVRSPKCISPDKLGVEALHAMETHRITSLAVVNGEDELLGLIHLHDLWKTKLF